MSLFLVNMICIFIQINIKSKVENKNIVREEVRTPSNFVTPKKINYKLISVNNAQELFVKREYFHVYTINNLDLQSFTVPKKKEAFIRFLLPTIRVIHSEIERDKEAVRVLSKKESFTEEEMNYLKNLFERYSVTFGDWKMLKKRMIKYPASLILSQAAIESGWGTSRFFKEGNNIFGMWSLNPKEKRIGAQEIRENGFKPFLREYSNPKDSVEDFMNVLSRVEAYSDLRKAVNEGKSPEEIAEHLTKYSEQGTVYVEKVKSVLKYNNFEQYDI